MKFVVIPELKGRWVWELRTAEGVPMARSPLSYGEKSQVLAVIRQVRAAVRRARTVDPLGASLEDRP